MVKAITATFVAALAMDLMSAGAYARDQQCSVLEALGQKYTGVKLTPEQETLKVKLTAWYMSNCKGLEVARATPSTALSAIR